MKTGKPTALPSCWDANQVRTELLNPSPSGKDTKPLLRAFLSSGRHIQVIRQLTTGERTKLLEIIDQVSHQQTDKNLIEPDWLRRVEPG